ncbi:hypothetical protein Q1695_002717 [Nippostrongylus brasiliensis]|nr:hypothetical protein Q1695_002717 [Nippostrongylus brasiliensis]
MAIDLANPELELLDPCPDIHLLFIDFNDRFFEGVLASCEVKWSPRMFSCAGVCSYEGRGGMCSIRLSLPLLKLRPRKDLVETLLHEMIHAFLFVTRRDRDRDGHGQQFQFHMHRINRMANVNITIYHSFHDEVAVYKQHIWRCDGPCRERRPFFGYVKRSSNRAPGPNDLWWKDHKASCNGTFQKISEPEGYGQRKKKAMMLMGISLVFDGHVGGEVLILFKVPLQNQVDEKKPISNNPLDLYFSNLGRGQTIGSQIEPFPSSSSSGGTLKPSPPKTFGGSTNGKGITNGSPRKRTTAATKTKSPTKVRPAEDFFIPVKKKLPSQPPIIEIDIIGKQGTSTATVRSLPETAAGSASCPIVVDDDSSLDTSSSSSEPNAEVTLNRNVTCPACGESVVEYFINDHLDSCFYLQ